MSNNNLNINIANFLDWCGNRPRMLALVGLLLTCSLFILFFGEYVEENLGTNKFFRRQIQNDPSMENNFSNQKPSNLEQQNICSSKVTTNNSNPAINYTVSIFQNCQKCSDFERNALQIEHCNPTGFYNAYLCTDNLKNNSTVYIVSDPAIPNHQRTNFSHSIRLHLPRFSAVQVPGLLLDGDVNFWNNVLLGVLMDFKG
uniref:Uncharacterized protein n=1 Tax=Meloidogyne hapla TaxID=6305 RepID=A0A1I8C1V1_MELHA